MAHFLLVPSNNLSSWLLSNYLGELWTVDEEYELSGRLDFPCSTEDLASELCKVNRILQVMVPDHIGTLDLSTLDRVVIHHLTSTEHISYTGLYLRWEWQSPEKIWILSDQTGMPAIINFRERKLIKMLLEVRDQENLNTYTYTYAEQSGKISFFCNSVGFGIPYATQYTNP